MNNVQMSKESFGKKIKRLSKLAAGIFFGVIVFVIIMASIGGSGSNTASVPSTQTNSPAVTQTAKATGSNSKIGDEVYVKSGLPDVFVGTTESSQNKLGKALLAKDTYGVAELLNSGLIFSVKEGTKVLVIGQAMGIRQIRMLEGDNLGKSGWIPFEWLSQTK